MQTFFFPQWRNPKLFSAASDKKNTHKNSRIWYSDVLLFKRYRNVFILKMFARLVPLFPHPHIWFMQASDNKCPFWCRPMPGTMSSCPEQQTVSRQLNCHFDFVSVSEPSKAWFSNSDGAATNQTHSKSSTRICSKVSQSGLLFLGMLKESMTLCNSHTIKVAPGVYSP